MVVGTIAISNGEETTMLIPMTITLDPDDLYEFNEVVLHPEEYHAEHANDPRDPELDTKDPELETSGKDPEIPTEPTPHPGPPAPGDPIGNPPTPGDPPPEIPPPGPPSPMNPDVWSEPAYK
jgi:hypothetical protein